MRSLVIAVLALTFCSSVALADEKGGKGEKTEKGEKPGEKPGAKGEKSNESDDDEEAADAGKPTTGRRSAAQIAFRKEVWERREKAVEAKVHHGGKHITEEEREAIRKHWLNVSRLMRIREMAQEDKADAIVKRADAALEKEEKSIDSKLEKLASKGTGGAK